MVTVRDRIIKILKFGILYLVLTAVFIELIPIVHELLRPIFFLIFILFGLLVFLFFGLSVMKYYYIDRLKNIDTFVLKGQNESDNGLRVAVILFFVFTLSLILNQIFTYPEALLISSISIFVIVVITDRVYGRDMVGYVKNLKENYDKYVQSLFDGNIKCQSCNITMKPKEHDFDICNNCGFKQVIVRDSKYISKLA